MLFQTDNEFIEELNNRKETESVDIQNKSHKVNENISNKKHPRIKTMLNVGP